MSYSIKHIFLLIISITYLSAQDHVLGPEANNWYFGEYAGITFNTTDKNPVSIRSYLSTEEGTAVISDEVGNLLFYAQGDKIWNKNHEIMLNGSNLKGGSSATQAALIVQKPKSNNIFFVFNTCNLGGPLYYSIVDLKGDGGLGEVIQKNITVYDSCAEKLIAIDHSNKSDIWIIVKEKFSYNFRSYLLTSEGLSLSPVLSVFNLSYNLNNDYSTMGYLSVSPDGYKLAAATYSASQVELYDFNPNSGELSKVLELPLVTKEDNNHIVYGVCFSPDASKLYCSTLENGDSTYLLQFDLINGSRNEILKSKQIIASSFNGKIYGAIQAAPDGKLYISKYLNTYLSVITYPDRRGSLCEFNENAIYLDGSLCRLGLPNFAYQKLNVVEKPDPKIHNSLIKINSALGKPGDIVELPVLAKLLTDSIISSHLSYNISFEFSAAAFLPEWNQSGLTENFIQNGVRILHFNGLINSLNAQDQELFRLRGTLLLGDKQRNDIIISSFSWSDTSLVAFLESGNIVINEVCKSDLRKVSFVPKVQIESLQNVISNSLQINFTSNVDTRAVISFYSITGQKMSSQDIKIFKSEIGMSYNFEVQVFPAGLYFLELITEYNQSIRLSFLKN